jgi:uracil phosphoribosyltransferase
MNDGGPAAAAGRGRNLTVLDHPLVQHKVALLRDRRTNVRDFRALAREITLLMSYEALRDLPLTETIVETPLAEARAYRLAGKKLAVVGILRAGLSMVEAVLELVPSARVGHIGLYRDPQTHQPVEYYRKLPAQIDERDVVLVDPMLATGGSAAAAVGFLKEAGAYRIRLLSLIGAPEGVSTVHDAHPEVAITLAALDSHLNDHAYIVPGLGDAGDRIYGTK